MGVGLLKGSAGIRAFAAQHSVVLSHCAALLAVIAPLFVVDVPALVDYPNHLARMRVLAELGGSPELQEIYAVQWAVLPNLAMDLLVPPMGKLIGILTAGKVFIAMTLVVNVAGVVALSRVLHGRVGWSTLVVYLVLYNYVFAYGFLNYLFGVGLFLLLFAFWIASDGWPWPRRLGLAALGTVAIFVSHLGAFATYGLCVAGYELGRWLRSETRSPGELLRQVCLVVGQCLPPLVLMLTVVPSMPGTPDFYYDLSRKFKALVVPALFYEQALDFAFFAAFVLLLFFVVRGRGIRFAAVLLMPVAALGLAVLLVPTWTLGNFGNGFRLAVPLVLLLIAGSRISLDRPKALALATIGLLLFVTRMATITLHWIDYDRMYSEMRTAARSVEPGSRILPAVEDWSDVDRVAPTPYHRVFYHAPALLLLERPVFLPSIFTAEGRQPLSVQPAYARQDVPHMTPLPIDRLVLAVNAESRDELLRTQPFHAFQDRFADWPASFDYVLMLDFGAPRNPLPHLLAPTHSGSYFTLYKVL